MKKCPFCGADIEESARFCLYCMQSLTEKEQLLPYKKKKPQWLPIIAAVVALSLILMLILLGKQSPSESKTPSGAPPLDPPPATNQETPPDSLHIHDFSVANATTAYQKNAATCTTPATFYYSCTCGEKGSETFPYGETADHTIVTKRGYAATCQSPGLSDGTHCSVCNTVLLSQTQTPVVSHTYDNDQDENCNVCNYIRVLNCSHGKTVKLAAVSPTCTAGGLTEGTKCSLCDEILTAQTTLAPSGHKTVIDQAIPPTCTTDGKSEGKHCVTCHTVLVAQVTLDAKGHTEVIDPAVAATCTTSGKTEGKHCATCNITLVYQQHILALGHSFDSENILAPCSACGASSPHTHNYSEENTAAEFLMAAATCTQPATYYYSCICGEKGAKTFTYGKKTGHTPVPDPGYPPTCEDTGLTDGMRCSVCQDVLAQTQIIAATGHSYMLSRTPTPCLDCGKVGEFAVDTSPEVPCVLNNTLRINSCTYTVYLSSDDTWFAVFYLNYTNVSSETTKQHPFASAYPAGEGYGLGCPSDDYKDRLAPNESGDCLIYAQLPKSFTMYTLKLNAG